MFHIHEDTERVTGIHETASKVSTTSALSYNDCLPDDETVCSTDCSDPHGVPSQEQADNIAEGILLVLLSERASSYHVSPS